MANRQAGRVDHRWVKGMLPRSDVTGQSDVILANSKFTSRVYANAFPSLAKRKSPPKVVYPCIDLEQYAAPKAKGKAREDLGVTAITS